MLNLITTRLPNAISTCTGALVYEHCPCEGKVETSSHQHLHCHMASGVERSVEQQFTWPCPALRWLAMHPALLPFPAFIWSVQFIIPVSSCSASPLVVRQYDVMVEQIITLSRSSASFNVTLNSRRMSHWLHAISFCSSLTCAIHQYK